MADHSERTTSSSAATVSLDQLIWIGEEGERIACAGHVDLASFAAAADALTLRDVDEHMDAEELPSADYEATHVWWRPMTWEWFQQRNPTASREVYDAWSDEGAMEVCGPDDDGAQAFTVIETGA